MLSSLPMDIFGCRTSPYYLVDILHVDPKLIILLRDFSINPQWVQSISWELTNATTGIFFLCISLSLSSSSLLLKPCCLFLGALKYIHMPSYFSLFCLYLYFLVRCIFFGKRFVVSQVVESNCSISSYSYFSQFIILLLWIPSLFLNKLCYLDAIFRDLDGVIRTKA